ncbi:MAG: FecR domain-containing protein, partial [Candidatus Aminicenantes bacterium]|nr:FecR domain-containing protein [Candidatus Aminicenantes bacterium]
MKKQMILLTMILMVTSFVFGEEYESYYAPSYARLNYVNGDVYIQRAGDLGFEQGEVNLPLIEGDKLGTRDGRAEIHFGDKNYLRIDRDSQIDLQRLPREGDDLIIIHLLEGSLYLRVNNLRLDKGIEIHTPDSSFYVLDNGLYRIDVRGSLSTELYVLEGEMEASGQEGSVAVTRGERLLAENGAFQYIDDYNAGTDESFADWSRSRDSFQNQNVYRSYLPAELDEYESELAYYGRWVNENPYGYVWVPNVHNSSWQPYQYGRWVWYPIIGWTWVSSEPWGWCVSHYGRWHWRGGLGWYWIPQNQWRPAWVNWHHGADYIGWAPLSYWNRPGVILNNRYYDRYNGDYPYNSRALTVVHRNQLQSRHISKVALRGAGVNQLGRMSLSARQPGVQHVRNLDRTVSMRASQVMKRSSVRKVNNNFNSRQSVRSSRGNPSNRNGDVTRSSMSNRTVIRKDGQSRSGSARNIPNAGRSTTTSSRSTVRTYPSSGTSTSRARVSTPSRTSSSSSSRTVRSTPSRSTSSSRARVSTPSRTSS